MARTINPIRKELVKAEYIKTGGNGYKALKAGGCKESVARHSVGKDNTLLNMVKEEILAEIDKEQLALKAYKTLERNLLSERPSDQNTAATALLDFTEGKKTTQQVNITEDKLKAIDQLSNRFMIQTPKAQEVASN